VTQTATLEIIFKVKNKNNKKKTEKGGGDEGGKQKALIFKIQKSPT